MTFDQLEAGLTMVAGAEGGPPDFYLQVEGQGLPMTTVARKQFGRLTGVKAPTYKEFIADPALAKRMVKHSMNKANRGGAVRVFFNHEEIVNFYAVEKPHHDVQAAWDCLRAAGGATFGYVSRNGDGSFELAVQIGEHTKSTCPGIFMHYSDKATLAPIVMFHEKELALGPYKQPKRRKNQQSADKAFADLVDAKGHESVEASEFVLKTSADEIPEPPKFLGRMCIINKLGGKAAERITLGSAENIAGKTSLYYVSKFVAGLSGGIESADRRYQTFAYSVAYKGHVVCKKCGFPQD